VSRRTSPAPSMPGPTAPITITDRRAVTGPPSGALLTVLDVFGPSALPTWCPTTGSSGTASRIRLLGRGAGPSPSSPDPLGTGAGGVVARPAER